ncbi:hypothetical protein BH11ARM2_BH11ARM2_23450 [soil metagenome]
MADEVEAKLRGWTASASDDVDLRTDEGLQDYAARYAQRKNVTMDEALEATRARLQGLPAKLPDSIAVR